MRESVRALARRLALWVTGSDSKLPASTFFLFPFLFTLPVAVLVSTSSGLKRINIPRLAFCQTKAIMAYFLSILVCVLLDSHWQGGPKIKKKDQGSIFFEVTSMPGLTTS